MYTFILSGAEPASVETSTRSKYPSAVARRFERSSLVSLNSSPSVTSNSRRITLSRVLELPRISMRSKYTSGPRSTGTVTSTS